MTNTRVLKRATYIVCAVSILCANTVMAKPAIAESSLTESISRLESLRDSKLSAPTEETLKKTVDETFDITELSKRITTVTKTIKKSNKAMPKDTDVQSLAEDVESLAGKLRENDEYHRFGWTYTPPAKGTAKGTDIARAAVDLATSAQPDPEYTDPMDAHGEYYRQIHDQVLPGEGIKPCSVVVSVAVHYSGADPDFPRNTSSVIHAYCKDSPKWQLVGHGPDKSQMEPGDIFTSDYHTYMYIGNDIVRERFPESGADVYTGGNQLPYLYWDSYENKNFDVYRFVG